MDLLEATLRILCMTDGKEGMHTLEKQEKFVEIVKSRDVEVNIVNFTLLVRIINVKMYNTFLTRWVTSLRVT